MGNPKQKWTSEEEEALRAGIAKYGAGKWKFIQKDPDFHKFLHSRSNIDLKDKWRNMSAAAGQGSRDKLRTPKPKPNEDAPPAPLFTVPPPAPLDQPVPADSIKDEPANNLPAPRYNEMIFELLSKEPNGLDIGAILTYIEQRMEVPQNFRKQLGARLRRLVQQDKLEKVDSCYRIKNNSLSVILPYPLKEIRPPGESLEEAAKTAASKVAEAENKSFMAAEAVKEAERISKMAEETDSILQLAKEILERCKLLSSL